MHHFRKGHCLPTTHHTVRSLGGADIEFRVGDHTGTGRVIWTDYEYALIYECSHPNEDGSCDPEYVSMVVFGRTRELPDSVVEHWMTLTTCVNKENFERIPQGGTIILLIV